MRAWPRGRPALAVALALVSVFAFSTVASAAPPPGSPGQGLYHRHVCGGVTGPFARCNAEVRTNDVGTPLATASYVSGYAPASLQDAYAVATAAAAQGGSSTVGIVDAYDAPNAAGDLAVYRTQFNLPSCGTGCFRKVNQSGGTTAPSANASWAQETSLDLDMVSAICPNCHILLVEANSNSYADLAAAVDTAAALGATQISNSYGGSETFGGPYESHYIHAGVDITVSSGDSGYGVEFPASSPHVSAVGGTHLVRSSTARGWTETVWSGAGSGCSSSFAKQSWQQDGGCSRRTVADVSAVADPNTGVAVYDSYAYNGQAGWFVFGGTSVAAPLIAAIDGLAGGRANGDSPYGSYPYNHPEQFNDVTSGSNGSCSGSYLCTGAFGYDGPTGIGTPNGAGAAAPVAAPTKTGDPSISPANPTEGQTLTANPGTWTGSPTYAYQWQLCSPTCGDITGATGSTYKVQHTDVTHTIDVVVTATNSGGFASATSAQTAAVQGDFSLASSPTSVSVRRGQTASYVITISGTTYGSVSFGVTGAPAGSTVSYSSNPTSTGSTTVSVATSASTPSGSRTLTITGDDGTHSHLINVTLTVRKSK